MNQDIVKKLKSLEILKRAYARVFYAGDRNETFVNKDYVITDHDNYCFEEITKEEFDLLKEVVEK